MSKWYCFIFVFSFLSFFNVIPAHASFWLEIQKRGNQLVVVHSDSKIYYEIDEEFLENNEIQQWVRHWIGEVQEVKSGELKKSAEKISNVLTKWGFNFLLTRGTESVVFFDHHRHLVVQPPQKENNDLSGKARMWQKLDLVAEEEQGVQRPQPAFPKVGSHREGKKPVFTVIRKKELEVPVKIEAREEQPDSDNLEVWLPWGESNELPENTGKAMYISESPEMQPDIPLEIPELASKKTTKKQKMTVKEKKDLENELENDASLIEALLKTKNVKVKREKIIALLKISSDNISLSEREVLQKKLRNEFGILIKGLSFPILDHTGAAYSAAVTRLLQQKKNQMIAQEKLKLLSQQNTGIVSSIVEKNGRWPYSDSLNELPCLGAHGFLLGPDNQSMLFATLDAAQRIGMQHTQASEMSFPYMQETQVFRERNGLLSEECFNVSEMVKAADNEHLKKSKNLVLGLLVKKKMGPFDAKDKKTLHQILELREVCKDRERAEVRDSLVMVLQSVIESFDPENKIINGMDNTKSALNALLLSKKEFVENRLRELRYVRRKKSHNKMREFMEDRAVSKAEELYHIFIDSNLEITEEDLYELLIVPLMDSAEKTKDLQIKLANRMKREFKRLKPHESFVEKFEAIKPDIIRDFKNSMRNKSL